MKFKLVETYNDYALDDLRDLVQEYIYDAVDQLKGAPVETYLEWFKEQLSEYDDIKAEDLETVVTDVFIEATDSGKIKRPKTMITSQLKDYIESNSNLLDNVDALMNNCPQHLRHELKLALDVAEVNKSLNERFDEDKARSTLVKGHIFTCPTANVDKFQLFDKPNTLQKVEDNYCIIYDVATEDHPLTHQTILNKLEKELKRTIDTCAFVCMYDTNSDKVIVELSDDKFNIFKNLLIEASQVFFMSF